LLFYLKYVIIRFNLSIKFMWKKFRKALGKKLTGLSLRWDPDFLRNVVVVVGVVFVWRGIWNLMDKYFFPDLPYAWNNIISILLGALILYLPDSSIDELGENELFPEKKQKK